MIAHHYTDSEVKTAAAAVNAGTCLEDANLAANIFSHIGDAVKAVSSTFKIMNHNYQGATTCLHNIRTLTFIMLERYGSN